MDKEALIQKIQDIGTCEDVSTQRTMLVDLQTEVTNLFDTNENLTKQNEDLSANVAKLQECNMKLFLSVGVKDEPDDPKDDPKPDKPKFEDLFNDKGGIK